MPNCTYKTGIIYLNFVGNSKNGSYLYRTNIKSPKATPNNSESKSLFKFIFGKKNSLFSSNAKGEPIKNFDSPFYIFNFILTYLHFLTFIIDNISFCYIFLFISNIFFILLINLLKIFSLYSTTAILFSAVFFV